MVLKGGYEMLKSFRRLLDVQIAYLTYCGVWVLDLDTHSVLRYGYFAWKIFVIATMYIFTITVFADIYTNINDISVATDSGCICAGIIVVIFKIMVYQLNHKEIKELNAKVTKCVDELVEFSVDSDRVVNIIKRYYSIYDISFCGFKMVACCLIIALLLFSPTVNGLPIRAKYPFNTSEFPYRGIGLAVETVTVSAGVLAILEMDSITLISCTYIILGLNILNVNLENCDRHTAEDTDSAYRKPSDMFVTRFKTCLRFHQQLITAINDYNNLYSSSVFVQVLSSTSIICLTSFQAVVVGEQNSDVIKFGVYLSTALSQLLYICWIGNELTYSCSILDTSQWLSKWHHNSICGIRQLFVISMMAMRHPMYMKAGPFFVCSLQAYIAIVKSSYSVYALLSNVQTTES